jgi:hypothetical protein
MDEDFSSELSLTFIGSIMKHANKLISFLVASSVVTAFAAPADMDTTVITPDTLTGILDTITNLQGGQDGFAGIFQTGNTNTHGAFIYQEGSNVGLISQQNDTSAYGAMIQQVGTDNVAVIIQK